MVIVTSRADVVEEVNRYLHRRLGEVEVSVPVVRPTDTRPEDVAGRELFTSVEEVDMFGQDILDAAREVSTVGYRGFVDGEPVRPCRWPRCQHRTHRRYCRLHGLGGRSSSHHRCAVPGCTGQPRLPGEWVCPRHRNEYREAYCRYLDAASERQPELFEQVSVIEAYGFNGGWCYWLPDFPGEAVSLGGCTMPVWRALLSDAVYNGDGSQFAARYGHLRPLAAALERDASAYAVESLAKE